MAARVERRTLILSPDGPVHRGGKTMSASVMTIQRRHRGTGHACGARSFVIAVAILVSLLIIANNDGNSASTKTVVPTQSSSTPGSDIACGVGHPC